MLDGFTCVDFSMRRQTIKRIYSSILVRHGSDTVLSRCSRLKKFSLIGNFGNGSSRQMQSLYIKHSFSSAFVLPTVSFADDLASFKCIATINIDVSKIRVAIDAITPMVCEFSVCLLNTFKNGSISKSE